MTMKKIFLWSSIFLYCLLGLFYADCSTAHPPAVIEPQAVTLNTPKPTPEPPANETFSVPVIGRLEDVVWINGMPLEERSPTQLILRPGDLVHNMMRSWIVKGDEVFLKFRNSKAAYGTDCWLNTGQGEKHIGIIFDQPTTQEQFDQTVRSNPHIYFITLFHCKKVNSFAGLTVLHNLETLNVYGVPIADISPLENVPSLKRLDLAATEVTDARSIAKLKNLEFLTWYNSDKITDAVPLGQLTVLRSLDLDCTKIADLSFAANLKNLHCLKVGYTDISDITAIADLKQLQYLGIARTKVRNIAVLRDLMELTYLDLGYTRFQDISVLAGHAKLRTIVLSGSRVPDEQILELKQKLPGCRFDY